MVDKRVSVMLIISVYGIVTIDFLLTHRVLLVPVHEHGDGPRQDFRLVGHVAAAPIVVFTVVTNAHVHEGASVVALISINRLKHSA